MRGCCDHGEDPRTQSTTAQTQTSVTAVPTTSTASATPPPSLAASRAAALNELTQPATMWGALPPAYVTELARAYLDGPGRQYKSSVTPAALLAELTADQKQGIDDTTGTISNMLRVAADFSAARANGDARAKYLNSGLVDKTPVQVRHLIGDPDHTQDIGGQVIWYYTLGGNTYQLLFSGDAVTQVNKY